MRVTMRQLLPRLRRFGELQISDDTPVGVDRDVAGHDGPPVGAESGELAGQGPVTGRTPVRVGAKVKKTYDRPR